MIPFIKSKINKSACLLACIHFVISFFTDQILFTYVLFDCSNFLNIAKTGLTFISKGLFFVFLMILYHYLFFLFKKENRKLATYIGIYFVIMIVFLLFTYPGIWRIDEFGILFEAGNAMPVFWQNYLTSYIYMMALMFLPFPASVIALQCFVNSIIVGTLISQLQRRNIITRWIYACYLPFLAFPIISSNLYPMRMSVYAFLELFVLAKLCFLYMDLQDHKKIELKDFLSFFFLIPIVVVLRSEAIYYFIAFPVCFVLICKEKLPKKLITKVILLTTVFSVLLLIPQKVGEKIGDGDEYTLTSMVLPLVPLVYEANSELEETDNEGTRNEITEILDAIDPVVSVNQIVKAYEEGKNGISLFWSEYAAREYTESEFKKCQQAYYTLIKKYPLTFLEERLQTFLQSSDLLENTTLIYENNGVANHEKFASYTCNKPINKSVRNSVISFIEWRSQSDYTVKLIGYTAIYHVLVPLLILLITLLMLLFKKKWTYAIILASHLAKVPLIFLTAPSRLFMYYYPVYLTGGVIAFIFLIRKAGKKYEQFHKDNVLS